MDQIHPNAHPCLCIPPCSLFNHFSRVFKVIKHIPHVKLMTTLGEMLWRETMSGSRPPSPLSFIVEIWTKEDLSGVSPHSNTLGPKTVMKGSLGCIAGRSISMDAQCRFSALSVTGEGRMNIHPTAHGQSFFFFLTNLRSRSWVCQVVFQLSLLALIDEWKWLRSSSSTLCFPEKVLLLGLHASCVPSFMGQKPEGKCCQEDAECHRRPDYLWL